MSWVPRIGAGGRFLSVISWKILERKFLQELAWKKGQTIKGLAACYELAPEY